MLSGILLFILAYALHSFGTRCLRKSCGTNDWRNYTALVCDLLCITAGCYGVIRIITWSWPAIVWLW